VVVIIIVIVHDLYCMLSLVSCATVLEWFYCAKLC